MNHVLLSQQPEKNNLKQKKNIHTNRQSQAHSGCLNSKIKKDTLNCGPTQKISKASKYNSLLFLKVRCEETM